MRCLGPMSGWFTANPLDQDAPPPFLVPSFKVRVLVPQPTLPQRFGRFTGASKLARFTGRFTISLSLRSYPSGIGQGSRTQVPARPGAPADVLAPSLNCCRVMFADGLVVARPVGTPRLLHDGQQPLQSPGEEGGRLRIFEGLAQRSDQSLQRIDCSIVRAHEHADGGKKGTSAGEWSGLQWVTLSVPA